MSDRPLRVGILGGGQLGRMIALAARPLGLEVHLLAPGPAPPCAVPAVDHWVAAPYNELDAVRGFASAVDVVTCEFENVPARTAEVAAEETRVAPSPSVLAVAQDRILEKRSFAAAGVGFTDHVAFENETVPSPPVWSAPGVLKTAHGGYDGKGQQRVDSFDEAVAAWQQWGRPRAVLERFIDFSAEVSVLVARGATGETAVYAPFANVHRDHVLDLTITPAPMPEPTLEAARRTALAVAEHLDVIGLLCVEMFVLEDGGVLVNEIAPRPHNSGHVTMDACVTGQFEQLLRAVFGWPLGSVGLRGAVGASANLLGQHLPAEAASVRTALDDPEVRLHLYGKNVARHGRKMGHLNLVADSVGEARRRVLEARSRLVAARERESGSTNA